LLIRIKRKRDGSAALTCVRSDGSSTWQRQDGSLGLVFPTHDLTHYAVETAFGMTGAFFGLIASGWEIDDFAPPYPRGRIPDQAREAELLVSVFQMEHRHEDTWSAADFVDHGRRYLAARGRRETVAFPAVSETQLQAVRDIRRDVFARWDTVPPGDHLELRFGGAS
jgi:hypothetical protein